MIMSAFHLLNVSPELSRAEIDAAYEDAGFNDRAPEGVLQKAVGVLTASKPRLYEEVSYWWGIPLHKIDEFTHIENPDTGKILACEAIKTMPLLALTRANMAAYLCENKSIGNTNTFVDRLNTLIKEQKNIDTDDVGKMINHARKKSGVVPRDCAKNPARSCWRKTQPPKSPLSGGLSTQFPPDKGG